jgi:thioredoxin-related protein
MTKKIFVIVWIALLFGVIGVLFWYNELQYQLPTPIPKNYKAVTAGELIKLNSKLRADTTKPVFLHFFNPTCPCSKFNIKMFKSLVAKYDKKINFALVVISDKQYTADEIRAKFDMNIPVSFDQTLAAQCGVYSTPQVALIDDKSKLYYRGNYNITRYCTDEKTNYAQQAINGVLVNNGGLTFNKLALTSYGCRLVQCKN